MAYTTEKKQKAYSDGYSPMEVLDFLYETTPGLSNNHKTWVKRGMSANDMVDEVIRMESSQLQTKPIVTTRTITPTTSPRSTASILFPDPERMNLPASAVHSIGQGALTGLATIPKIVGTTAWRITPEYYKRRGITTPEQTATYKFGKAVENAGKKLYPVKPELVKHPLVQVGSAVGSAGAFMAQSYILGTAKLPLWLASSVTGAATNAVSQYEDAIRNGASVEKALLASDIGAVVGTTEAVGLGRVMGRIDKYTGGQGTHWVLGALSKAGVSSLEEGLQEGGQNLANNISAKILYDTSRDLMDGVSSGAGVGATIGFFATMLGISIKRKLGMPDVSAKDKDLLNKATKNIDQAQTVVNEQSQPTQLETDITNSLSDVESPDWQKELRHWNKKTTRAGVERFARFEMAAATQFGKNPAAISEFKNLLQLYLSDDTAYEQVYKTVSPEAQSVMDTVTATRGRISLATGDPVGNVTPQLQAELRLFSELLDPNTRAETINWVEKQWKSPNTFIRMHDNITDEIVKDNINDLVSTMRTPQGAEFMRSKYGNELDRMLDTAQTTTIEKIKELSERKTRNKKQQTNLDEYKKALGVINNAIAGKTEVVPQEPYQDYEEVPVPGKLRPWDTAPTPPVQEEYGGGIESPISLVEQELKQQQAIDAEIARKMMEEDESERKRIQELRDPGPPPEGVPEPPVGEQVPQEIQQQQATIDALVQQRELERLRQQQQLYELGDTTEGVPEPPTTTPNVPNVPPTATPAPPITEQTPQEAQEQLNQRQDMEILQETPPVAPEDVTEPVVTPPTTVPPDVPALVTPELFVTKETLDDARQQSLGKMRGNERSVNDWYNTLQSKMGNSPPPDADNIVNKIEAITGGEVKVFWDDKLERSYADYRVLTRPVANIRDAQIIDDAIVISAANIDYGGKRADWVIAHELGHYVWFKKLNDTQRQAYAKLVIKDTWDELEHFANAYAQYTTGSGPILPGVIGYDPKPLVKLEEALKWMDDYLQEDVKAASEAYNQLPAIARFGKAPPQTYDEYAERIGQATTSGEIRDVQNEAFELRNLTTQELSSLADVAAEAQKAIRPTRATPEFVTPDVSNIPSVNKPVVTPDAIVTNKAAADATVDELASKDKLTTKENKQLENAMSESREAEIVQRIPNQDVAEEYGKGTLRVKPVKGGYRISSKGKSISPVNPNPEELAASMDMWYDPSTAPRRHRAKSIVVRYRLAETANDIQGIIDDTEGVELSLSGARHVDAAKVQAHERTGYKESEISEEHFDNLQETLENETPENVVQKFNDEESGFLLLPWKVPTRSQITSAIQKKIQESKSPYRDVSTTGWESSVHYLESLGPEGAEILRLTRNADKYQDIWFKTQQERLKKWQIKMNPAEQDETVMYVQGQRNIKLNEAQQQWADIYIKMSDEMADWVEKRGDVTSRLMVGKDLDIPTYPEWIREPNYWPRMYNWDNEIMFNKLVDKEIELRKGTIAELKVERGTKTDENDIARINREIRQLRTGREAVVAEMSLRKRLQGGRQSRHLERARKYDIPGFRTDMGVVNEYMRDVYRRRAEIEFFGKRDEVINDLLDTVGGQHGTDARELAAKIFHAHIGEISAKGKFTRGVETLDRKLGAWTVLSKMGLSALSQIPQIGNIPVRTGFKNHYEGMYRMLTDKKFKQLVNESAVILPEVFPKDMYTTNWFVNKFLRSNLFMPEDRLWRKLAGAAGVVDAEKWSNKLLSEQAAGRTNSSKFRKAQRMLSEYDVDTAQLIKHGALSDFQKKLVALTVSSETQFAGRSYDLPLGWQSPFMRFGFTTFKHFSYQQSRFTKNMFARSLNEIGRGNVMPFINQLGAFAGVTITGELVRLLKAYMYGTIDEEEWLILNLGQRMGAKHRATALLKDVTQAAFLGFMFDSIQNISRGPVWGLLRMISPKPAMMMDIASLGWNLTGGQIVGDRKKATRAAAITALELSLDVPFVKRAVIKRLKKKKKSTAPRIGR